MERLWWRMCLQGEQSEGKENQWIAQMMARMVTVLSHWVTNCLGQHGVLKYYLLKGGCVCLQVCSCWWIGENSLVIIEVEDIVIFNLIWVKICTHIPLFQEAIEDMLLIVILGPEICNCIVWDLSVKLIVGIFIRYSPMKNMWTMMTWTPVSWCCIFMIKMVLAVTRGFLWWPSLMLSCKVSKKVLAQVTPLLLTMLQRCWGEPSLCHICRYWCDRNSVE